jgi:phosphoglycolate phosphatase-like HAD superfamily hydrolase
MIVFVDVDDTRIHSFGTKRIPMPNVIDTVRQLKAKGAILYCWSTGGSEYAYSTAVELGLEDCFEAYLPKPNVMIDDQPFQSWRGLRQVYPLQAKTLLDELDI